MMASDLVLRRVRFAAAALLLIAAALPAHAESFAAHECRRLRAQAHLYPGQDLSVICHAPGRTTIFRCGSIVQSNEDWDDLTATVHSPRCAHPLAKEGQH